MEEDPMALCFSGENQTWLFTPIDYLQSQLSLDPTLKPLLQKQSYHLALYFPPNRPIDLPLITSLQSLTSSPSPRTVILQQSIQPSTKFSLSVKKPTHNLTIITITIPQPLPKHLVTACNRLLQKGQAPKASLLVFFEKFEVVYAFKTAGYQSFYMQPEDSLVKVFGIIAMGMGRKEEEKKVEDGEQWVVVRVEDYEVEGIPMGEFNKVKQSCWRLRKDNKVYLARANLTISEKQIQQKQVTLHSQLSTLTKWLYNLLQVPTVQSSLVQLPVSPQVPLAQLYNLKPKQKPPQYKPLLHILQQITPELIDYSACDSYSQNFSDSLLIREGKIVVKGKMYKVVGLMRMLAIAHVFNDEEVFREVGRVLRFRLDQKEAEAEAVKGATSINLATMGQGYKNTPKTQPKQKQLGPKPNSIPYSSLDPTLTNQFLSSLIGIRVMQYHQLLTSPCLPPPLKPCSASSMSTIMTRMRRILQLYWQGVTDRARILQPLVPNNFELHPSLYDNEKEPVLERDLVARKEKVVLVYSNEDEILDQLIMELMEQWKGVGRKVFLLDCKGLAEEHIKEVVTKKGNKAKPDELIVFIRNYHKILQNYKMNIYQQCDIEVLLPHVRLFITCPKHYLIHNYQSWFKPHPQSLHNFLQLQARDLSTLNILRSISRTIQNPQPYLDLLYNDSCLSDLLCTPALFSRFFHGVSTYSKLKPLNGYTLFKCILENALKMLRWNGVRKKLYGEFVEALRDMAMNYLLRGARNHRVVSYELWEVLCGYTSYSLIRLESDNCIAFLHANLAEFYVANMLMQEAFSPECKIKDCVQLFKSPLLRKILKEMVTEEDKQRLLQRVLDSKFTVYFGMPPQGSGIAISILSACGSNLSGLDLTLTQLPFSSLHNCNLQNTCLRAANLTSSDLTRAYCRNSQLPLARLSNKLKLDQLQSIKMKNSVRDILIEKQHDLLINTGGHIVKMNWENIRFEENFNQHSGVRLMAGSPGYLVTVSETKLVDVWEINTGQHVKDFQVGINYVEFMCVIQSYVVVGRRSVELEMWDYYRSIKAKSIINKALISFITTLGSALLVLGDQRGVVSLLEVPTTLIYTNFKAHDHQIVGIATAQDNILTASEDRTLRIWRRRHKNIIILKSIQMRQSIKSIYLSSTSDYCFVLCRSSTTILTKSLTQKARCFNPVQTMNCCCFDQKLKRLYIGTQNGISMVDFKSLYPMQTGHDCSVTVCTIDSYWHHIITGSVDTTIIVWSLKTYQLERVLMGHKEAITGLELFQWDQLISCSMDFTVRRWNVVTGQCLQVLEENSEIRTLVLNPKTNVIMSGSKKGAIQVFKVDKMAREFKLFKTHEAHKGAINKIACCVEEDRYLSASEDSTVIMWSEDVRYNKFSFNSPVTSLLIRGKNQCLCCSKDGSVKIINITTASIVSQFNLPASTILQVFVPSINLFVSVISNCIVLHENQRIITKHEAHPTRVNSIRYEATTGTIITASNDSCIGVWRHNQINNQIRLIKMISGTPLVASIVM